MTPEPSNEYQKLVETAVRAAAAEVRRCLTGDRRSDDEIRFWVNRTENEICAALSVLKLPHAGDDGWQDIATVRPGYPFVGAFEAPLQPGRWEIVGPGSVQNGVFRDGLGEWGAIKTVLRLPPLPTPPAGVSDNG